MENFKSKRNKWKSHISKTMGSQSHHHLKSNPKFWLFAGSSSDWGWKALWFPFVKIKVEKSLGRHSFGSEVEKPLGTLSSRSRLKSPSVATTPFPRLKSPLITTASVPRLKNPLVAIALILRLKSPLVPFCQDRSWKAPWFPFVKIKVEKPLGRHS